MTEGDQAGWRAVILLLIVGAAAYFTIVMIIFSFIRKLFWS
jgi:RsiW-degrading membrane proteinase PrsW (M82 family)